MNHYAKFDWKQSPAHIKCLSLFLRPKSRQVVEAYQFLRSEIPEGMEKAIQRFVDEGELIPPPLKEVINSIHNKGPIEEALRTQGLNPLGNKDTIIERLIKNTPDAARELVSNHDVLICSNEAREFLAKYEARKQSAEKETRHLVFTSLLKSNIKLAFEIFSQFQEEFVRNDGNIHVPRHYAPVIEILLTKEPALLEHLSARDKQYLRAATCMPMFWRDEPAANWLPEDFTTTFQSKDVICNLFKIFAEIQHSIKDAKDTSTRKITFDTYDIDSCEICRRLNGETLQIKHIPELPDLNCTSKKGCKFHLHYPTNDNNNPSYQDNLLDGSTTAEVRGIETLDRLLPKIEYEELKTYIFELVDKLVRAEVGQALDPTHRLRNAKQMFDEGLITEEDFNYIKRQIMNKLLS